MQAITHQSQVSPADPRILQTEPNKKTANIAKKNFSYGVFHVCALWTLSGLSGWVAIQGTIPAVVAFTLGLTISKSVLWYARHVFFNPTSKLDAQKKSEKVANAIFWKEIIFTSTCIGMGTGIILSTTADPIVFLDMVIRYAGVILAVLASLDLVPLFIRASSRIIEPSLVYRLKGFYDCKNNISPELSSDIFDLLLQPYWSVRELIAMIKKHEYTIDSIQNRSPFKDYCEDLFHQINLEDIRSFFKAQQTPELDWKFKITHLPANILCTALANKTEERVPILENNLNNGSIPRNIDSSITYIENALKEEFNGFSKFYDGEIEPSLADKAEPLKNLHARAKNLIAQLGNIQSEKIKNALKTPEFSSLVSRVKRRLKTPPPLPREMKL